MSGISGRSRSRLARFFVALVVAAVMALAAAAEDKKKEEKYLDPINVEVPHISTDKSIKYDYDIVYVRAPRAGDKVHKRFFTDFSSPVTMEPGADLMLLHPDGKEELLVKGGDGSITDPFVSFDAEWVYYVHLHNMQKASQWNPPKEGADIYKIHLKTKKIVKLTNQKFSPNTGAANWSSDYRTPKPGKSYFEYGVYNMGPCPLPGGRIAFTSNRDGFRPAKGYPAVCLQLFTMDDRDTDIGDDELPTNLEKIGHLNLAGALHPVVLRDGRIMYSTLESQGARGDILWGIWTINPDGTNWNPLVSAFDPGGAPNGFHFQTQLSNGDIVVEQYYNQNNSGFGAYIRLPRPGARENSYPFDMLDSDYNPKNPIGSYPSFGPANMSDPANEPWRYGRHDNGTPRYYKMPFMPTGSSSITPFTFGLEGPADRSILGDKTSPAVGKFTHPSGAPDNHLLTCYSPGPVNHQYTFLPQIDGGIYLIKDGYAGQPSEMRLIKNDPNYNECWPRAVVPYSRIYTPPDYKPLTEPKTITHIKNDGKLSKHLPEGTPFALVGTSSFYKRESYPNGGLPQWKGTATYVGKNNDPWKGLDAFTSHGNGMPLNWHNQGADAGLYTNEDIHAVRILAMEPTTDRKGADSSRRYYNHAGERLRVLGEIPLRKFEGDSQVMDSDHNADTSFLAKIPADVGFTFQTIDKRGMVLNAAQTWHQLRPGEIRNDCGGCHAHSQKPTDFKLTAAGKPDYQVWDLVNTTPILTDKRHDTSNQQWDTEDKAGLRFAKNGPLNVEYWRDVKPILARSCATCHTAKDGKTPKGNLNLDADDELVQAENLGKFPGTYYRLALDEGAKFGFKPVGWDSWGYPNASRYIRKFQSRRSMLVWKIYGERLDGFSNDDHPSEKPPGSGKLFHKGEEVDVQKNKARADIDYLGKPMPPPGWPGGAATPLTDDDRRTIVRWIDLGCPIDLDYDPKHPEKTGRGWMMDDQRPTLTLTYPLPGKNAELSRIVIGMHDYGSGLNMDSFRVTADFALDGVPAGDDLAAKFKSMAQGVWEWKLSKPLAASQTGKLIVSVADKQGNTTKIERTFTVGK
jgi:Hydrazine synthase alpha subunit middle domain